MGFDKDCIVDIHSLRGEYFCPVCRTLVYPNEALQSQCTHLYCRRCLTYIVRTTNICPYDGYLVTEEDSKPLSISDKALAERLDKTLVRCLYHRSGCSWQGPLSHCNSHCSGCSFRYSPIVCNRCGIRLLHYQKQEHAQTCVVPSPQAQTSSQLVAQALQAPVPQAATAPPSAHNANPVQANTSADWTPSERWYPQRFQLNYQQYPAYVPNRQSYQQYYPYQQQTAQQLHQHAPLVGGQPQLYAQNSAATQPHYQPVQQVHGQIQENTQPQIQNMAQNNIQERLMELSEARKKEQHQLHQQIVDLQKKHDNIQLLDLETEKLSGVLEIFRAYGEGGDVEATKKIESLEENLKDKDETIEHLEGLNQVLLIKERKSNDELQNARKELINLVQDGPTLQNSIGVKRMGDIDRDTIVSAATKIYPDAEVQDKAEEFYKEFQAKIKNPNWYPFKLIRMAGEDQQVLQQVIDEEDEYLRAIKTEWDTELYNAVLTAVGEMNEYNPSGRFFVLELWNYEEGRKATLAECVKSMGDFWDYIFRS